MHISWQVTLLKRMISAKDYFLLWGPPGTGKTSVMLKNLVKYLHQNTKENILLLAYTNRAVDEICEAIISILYFFPFLNSQTPLFPAFRAKQSSFTLKNLIR